MVGLPGIKDDLKTTIKLISNLKLFYPKVRVFLFFYTPYPGTQLYETALKYGLEAPSTLDGWADYTLDKIRTPWLKKKKKNLLSNLMFYFTIAHPSEDSMRGTPLTRLAKKLISFLARQRLRLNFYGLPLEAFVVNKYLKRKSSKGVA